MALKSISFADLLQTSGIGGDCGATGCKVPVCADLSVPMAVTAMFPNDADSGGAEYIKVVDGDNKIQYPCGFEKVDPTEPVVPTDLRILDQDRWCWPHSSAMTGAEIDTFAQRSQQFTWRGLMALDAEKLADKLVNRDRDGDDRRLCLECANLSRAGGWRCSQWQQVGRSPAVASSDLVRQLKRCNSFQSAG